MSNKNLESASDNVLGQKIGMKNSDLGTLEVCSH